MTLKFKLLAAAAAAIALLVAVWFASMHLISIGEDRVQAKWDVEKAVVAKEVAMIRERQVVVNQVVETIYKDRVRVIYERGTTIVKEVPFYVPSDTPPLPGGFRLLHDAAAGGEPLPGVAAIAGAAAVSAQEVASTVAGNYAVCLANAEQVKALQQWISDQRAASARSARQPAAPSSPGDPQ